MNITLHITKVNEFYSPVCMATIPEHYEGMTESLTFGGNTALAGESIRFDGFTRQEVINRVIDELKSRGLHGNLHVISK